MTSSTAAIAERPFYTLKQAAERWQVSEKKLLRLIKSGDLKAHKFGAQWRISHDDLRTYERLNRVG